MAYSIHWYIKNEIIFTRYWDTVTAEDLRNALIASQQYIESSPRNIVHIICDVGEVVQPVSLKDAVRVVREVGPTARAGWTLSIREKSAMVKMAGAFGSSILKLRFRAFNTLDQALAHLKYFDSHINFDNVEPAFAELTRV